MVSESPSNPVLAQSTPNEEPPNVPAKDINPNYKPVYNLKSPMATILMYRQSDLNISSTAFSGVDVYLNEAVDIKSKVAQLSGDSDKYWLEFLENYSENYIRETDPQKVENKVGLGLPADLRSAIYLTILNIKSVVDSHTYESLVKRAKLAEFEGGRKESDDGKNKHCELLQVYHYCLKGSQGNSQISGLLSAQFVESLAKILQQIENLEKPEMLTILFKLSEQLSHFSKEEFAYKGSRALEDISNAQFLYITKQGIDISRLSIYVLENLLAVEFDQADSLDILDLLLFEGPEYAPRLLCTIFEEQQDRISSHTGDALNEYLFSKSFLASVSKNTIQKSIQVEFPIIKYENEFSLIKANSISGNDNEISNLSETNQELTKKLENIRKDFSELQKTHEEIFGQNAEYASRLSQARDEKSTLLERKTALQEKYNQLTMQENLSNTIKANTDISRENQVLEEQIEIMRKKVEAKSKSVK